MKNRLIILLITVCLITLAVTGTAFANTSDSMLNKISEKNNINVESTDSNVDIESEAILGESESAVTRASSTTVNFTKFRQIIPTNTSMLSTGVVLNATVTYEIEVLATFKDNGVPLSNKTVTFSTTTSSSQVKLISSATTTTGNDGSAYATYHVRGDVPFNVTAKYDTFTGTTTITPSLNCYYNDSFYTTYYITALETDSYYTGSKISVTGLTGTYKSDFLADVRLQGSGKGADGKWIKYYDGVYSHTAPTTATGTTPTVGRTIAVDNTHIPRLSNQKAHVYITNVGYRQAEDAGGAITGHRIDVYVGIGRVNIVSNNGYFLVQYRGNNTWVSGTSPALGSINTELYNNDELIMDEKSRYIDEHNMFSSEDGSVLVYLDNVDYSRKNSVEIAVENNGKKIVLPLASSALGLYNVEFIDNTKIAVTGSINPSLQSYEIFDIIKGELIECYYGYGFTYDSDGNLFYVVPQPHFHDGDKGHNKIVDDKGDVLYESESNIIIKSNISIESDILYFEETNIFSSLIESYNTNTDYLSKKSIKINN